MAFLFIFMICELGYSDAGTSEDPFIVPRTESGMKIDAVLDEQAWANALVQELKYEVSPGENVLPPVRTEVLLTYGEKNLYIAFRCFDPEPSCIRARINDRDRAWDDDRVVAIFDTFNDERRAYNFCVNPFGVQMDYIRAFEIDDTGWDAIWNSAGKITDWGWVAEISVPFNSIRFQRIEGPQTWGFVAARLYPRAHDYWINNNPDDRSNDCSLCQAYKIEGFEGVTPGRNIELVPTLIGGRTDERSELPHGNFETMNEDVEGGFSGRWGVTTNMTLNGTINPDFSQVEADAMQLDINEPFALSFPEKRPFFTEGADYFSTLKRAVYTRTMRDPDWGMKLTGKEGVHTIGAYLVRDDVTNFIFPGSQSSSSTSLDQKNTSGVFRYKRDMGRKYTLGLMATDREGSDYYNRLVGIDGDIRLTNCDRVQIQALGSNTQYPDETAVEFDQGSGKLKDHFFAFEYDHRARNWGWWLDYDDVGPDFRADLGFIPMVGFRNVEGGVHYTWIGEPGSWWSSFVVGNELNYYEKANSDLLLKNGALWAQFAGIKQSHGSFGGRMFQEAYGGRAFDLVEYYGCLGFRPESNIWFHIAYYFGDRIDYANTRRGSRINLVPSLYLNLGRHCRLDFDHTFEHMSVDSGRLYTANISQVTAVFHVNTRTFFRSILQYVDYDYNVGNYTFELDSRYKHFFSQFLFSYKINPFTVFFVGYSDNYYGRQEYDLTQNDRTFFMKLSYAWVM